MSEEKDYINIIEMDDDDLRDMMDEDPKRFCANLAKQTRAEILEEIKGGPESAGPSTAQSQRTHMAELVKRCRARRGA